MKHLPPLLLVLALGTVAGVGWWGVLDRAEPVSRELVGLPSDGEATEVDEALAAIANVRKMATIRCAVKMQAAWPFEQADWSNGMLRAVVPGSSGSRVLFATKSADHPPIGLLRWSGASADQPGGCEVLATARSTVSGTVEIDGRSSSHGTRLRVCGQTVYVDADGGFEANAWAGQRCLAYVADPDLTQGFVPLVVEDLDATRVFVLAAPQDEPGQEIPRRYIVPSRNGAEQALGRKGLSAGAKKTLEAWAEQDVQRLADRRRMDAKAVRVLERAAPAVEDPDDEVFP